MVAAEAAVACVAAVAVDAAVLVAVVAVECAEGLEVVVQAGCLVAAAISEEAREGHVISGVAAEWGAVSMAGAVRAVEAWMVRVALAGLTAGDVSTELAVAASTGPGVGSTASVVEALTVLVAVSTALVGVDSMAGLPEDGMVRADSMALATAVSMALVISQVLAVCPAPTFRSLQTAVLPALVRAAMP